MGLRQSELLTYIRNVTGSDFYRVTDHPDRGSESVADYTTTASFHIPSNSLFTNHHFIRHCVVGATDKVAK